MEQRWRQKEERLPKLLRMWYLRAQQAVLSLAVKLGDDTPENLDIPSPRDRMLTQDAAPNLAVATVSVHCAGHVTHQYTVYSGS